MKHLILFIIICLLSLTACRSEQPDITAATPSATAPDFSETLNRLATQTQVAALTVTAESSPTKTTLEEISAVTPSPLPLLPPPLEKVGPFQQVSRQEAPIIGKVVNLQTGQDGSLYLLSESGYSLYKNNQWTAYFIGETGYLIGVDPQGRGWVVTHDGSSISHWQSGNDDKEIWIAYSENEGWTPPGASSAYPVNPGLFTDNRGHLWLSTAQDVRRFDGNHWEVFDAQTLGMNPVAEGGYPVFTIYPSPVDHQVYIGRCDWESMGPIGGGGLRAFDGISWNNLDPTFDTGCVTDISQDASGALWIALDATLYRYHPSSRLLETVKLPVPTSQTSLGYIISLTADPNGDLWAQFALCDGNACLNGTALYHLNDGQWLAIGEPKPSGGMQLLFDASGTPWLLFAGTISRVSENNLEEAAGLNVLAATTDPSGKIWLIAQYAGPPTLWTTP